MSLLQHVKISKSDRSSIIIFPGKCYAILIPKFCFQYSEFLDSVLTKGANIFKSFDFKLEGDFSLPRNTFELFHYDKFFLIGGLVPMTFGKVFLSVSVVFFLLQCFFFTNKEVCVHVYYEDLFTFLLNHVFNPIRVWIRCLLWCEVYGGCQNP